jgi:hypothetical protein
VDADADLDLVLGEVERRLPRRRHRARGERHAHAAAGLVHPARHLGDGGEVAALLGRRARELLEQHGDADPAAPGGVEAVLDRHVVVRHHRHDLDALGRGQLGGHLEVHDVAGVVLHDVQHARAAVDPDRRGEHLVGHRRGEHLTRTRGVEHARADEPAVHGLVPGAAAGDEPDLAPHRGVAAEDDAFREVDAQLGVGGRHAPESLGDDVDRVVDQLLHRGSPVDGPHGVRTAFDDVERVVSYAGVTVLTRRAGP